MTDNGNGTLTVAEEGPMLAGEREVPGVGARSGCSPGKRRRAG